MRLLLKPQSLMKRHTVVISDEDLSPILSDDEPMPVMPVKRIISPQERMNMIAKFRERQRLAFENFNKIADMCKTEILIKEVNKSEELLNEMKLKIFTDFGKQLKNFIDIADEYSDINDDLKDEIFAYKKQIEIDTIKFINNIKNIIPAEYEIIVAT